MKALHVSIILPCTVLALCIPAASLAETVTVHTDRASYPYGGNLTVSGSVSPVIPSEPVTILVLGTNYPHPEASSAIPAPDGSYSDTLPLPTRDVPAGNITVSAQYAGAKNQTAFYYAGTPCIQHGSPPQHYSVPIIRGPPAYNPRILDSSGNAVTGPVKAGQQIQISSLLANGLGCDTPFVYIVQVQDRDGRTVSLSWINGTLPAGGHLDPSQSWTPQYGGTYTAQIFLWQSLENPDALSPPASVSIDVVPDATPAQPPYGILPGTGNGPQAAVPSPLGQFRSGVTTDKIRCADGYVIAVRIHGHEPACVSPDTVPGLVLRGWSENPLDGLLLRYGNKTQADSVFHDVMEEPKIRDWSATGWRYNGYSYGQNGEASQSSATIFLYLPPGRTSHPECENGSYGLVVIGLVPVEIEHRYAEAGCEIVTTTDAREDPQSNILQG